MKKIAESHSQHHFSFDSVISMNNSFKLVHAAHIEDRKRQFFQITLEVKGNEFTTLLENEWFNYFDDIVLHSVTFNNEEPIVITLVLSPSVTSQLLKMDYELEHILAGLYKVNRDNINVLSQQENWFIVEASQQQNISEVTSHSEASSLKLAFKTSWYGILVKELILERKLSTPIAPEQTLISEVTKLLTEQRIEYTLEGNDNQFDVYIEFSSNNQTWHEIIRVNETDRIITCYAKFPHSIPLDKIDQVSLILMNENYSLVNGAFELDYNDGDLRFRTSILAYELSNMSQLAQVLGEHLHIMEQYIPGINQYLKQD